MTCTDDDGGGGGGGGGGSPVYIKGKGRGFDKIERK